MLMEHTFSGRSTGKFPGIIGILCSDHDFRIKQPFHIATLGGGGGGATFG